MANYCTSEDVSVLLGLDNFSSTTRPTLTQVNSIIADVTNEIDFVLAGVGITTQPTDARILGRLANAAKMGTACQVGLSAFGNATGVDNSQPDKFCTMYQEILEEIKVNPGLYSAISGDSTFYVSNPVLDGTTTEATVTGRIIPDDYEV